MIQVQRASQSQAAPDYGIDAPGIVRGFFLVGVPATVAGVGASALRVRGRGIPVVGWLLRGVGLVSLTLGALMLAYAKRGKFHHRERLLGMIDWRGDEQALDIGTGRGLLLIGAAKRLTTGNAVGIDIWRAEDLSGNARENTLHNAALEGVANRVTVESGDTRAMRFADATFDVILSLLCIHNIEDADERAAACREIARVLKPGGTALISDLANTADYARMFAAAGLRVSRSYPFVWETFYPLRIVTATKDA